MGTPSYTSLSRLTFWSLSLSLLEPNAKIFTLFLSSISRQYVGFPRFLVSDIITATLGFILKQADHWVRGEATSMANKTQTKPLLLSQFVIPQMMPQFKGLHRRSKAHRRSKVHRCRSKVSNFCLLIMAQNFKTFCWLWGNTLDDEVRIKRFQGIKR